MADSDSTLQSCSACGTPLDVGDFEPLTAVICPLCGESNIVGSQVGEFQLLEVLGRGGMGVVYRAQDTQLDRTVALKLLQRGPLQNGSLSALESEAALTASINHPHVVKVFTTGTAAGRFYIAMELVDRGTLDRLMEIQGRVAETQALEIASQIAQGLRAAHQHGLIHRDVKPGNILFSDAHTAKIVDFGLAIMEEAAHGTGEIWGTPYYISPERLDQKPEDFRSDMYSLGATLFHALAGRPPFEAADPTMVALKHLKSEAVSLQAFAPWVSGRTAYIVNRTLLKNPADRYQSYDELIEHLDYAREEVVAEAAKPKAPRRVVMETAEDQRRAGYLTTAMIALAVLLLGGAGYYFYFGGESTVAGPPGSAIRAVNAKGQAAPRFEEARQALLHDKPALAAEAFHDLAGGSSAAPFRQWARLHEGLAWLAAAEPEKSRAAFTQLQGDPVEAASGSAAYRDFFLKVATLGASEAPIPAGSLRDLDSASFPAAAFLVAGLKDWSLGSPDDAAAYLHDFISSAPDTAWAWLADYRELAAGYLADYSEYRGAVGRARDARSEAELQAAVTALQKVKRTLKHPQGSLLAKLDAALAETNVSGQERLKQLAAQTEKDRQALNAARQQIAAQARARDFAGARSTIDALMITEADLLREQRALLRKIAWLQQFRTSLIQDLAHGFPGPLQSAAGTPLAGAVRNATESGLQLVGDPAPPIVPWSDVSTNSILAMATSFFHNDGTQGQLLQRKWVAGVYGIFAGKKMDARKYLMDCARQRREYADLLPLLIPPHRSNVARGKPITTSDPAAAGDAAKAVDGDPATAWKSTAAGPSWLRVDLGKPLPVVRWVVRHASSQGQPAEDNTVNYVLQHSNDDREWEDDDRVQQNTQAVTDRAVGQTSARYLRLLIEKPNRHAPPDAAAQIDELELYSTAGPGEPVADLFAPLTAAPVPQLATVDLGLAANQPSGSTSVDDSTGTFTVLPSGAPFGGPADACRFLHRSQTGSTDLILRVQNSAAQTGLMLRESLAPDARMIFFGANPDGGLLVAVRKTVKTPPAITRDENFSAPCWLRLERNHGGLTLSASRDGRDWQRVASENLAMPNFEAGVAVAPADAHTPPTAAKVEIVSLGSQD